jgi:hypothetical protein
MRNKLNGISLSNLFYYKFLYSKLHITKDEVVSDINSIKHETFSRQAFNAKENNIPLTVYECLLTNIITFFNENCLTSPNLDSFIAVDGTCSNDINQDVALNMGFYDITNSVPIAFTYNGTENRNKEIYLCKQYISHNLDKFKKSILVCDRAYFCYDFIDFLIDNQIKFIIRVKGTGNNLINAEKGKDINIIKKIRPFVKLANTKSTTKIIHTKKGKKNTHKTYELLCKNDCIILTNLIDYSDEQLLNTYKSRWDIEVFFKYIKNNFKVQHTKAKKIIDLKKTYICELILTYLLKIISYYYLKTHPINSTIKKQNGNKVKCTIKINNSLLITNILKHILPKLLNGTLNLDDVYWFNKACIQINKNELNRSFPRVSKIPFSKWYIKEYSNVAQWLKILTAFIENNIDSLNDNLKIKAKQIIKITEIT